MGGLEVSAEGSLPGIALPRAAWLVKPQANEVLHEANFTSLFSQSPLVSGNVVAKLQGKVYERQTLTVPRSPAAYIRAVLRTSSAHVDRSRVLVAYQLYDTVNNVLVLDDVDVEMKVTNWVRANTVSSLCNQAGLQRPDHHFLGSCQLPSLPESWFEHVGNATIEIELKRSGSIISSYTLPEALSIHQKPPWYGSLPTQFSTSTAFAILPSSPVYMDENFTVAIYAHTGGYAISTFWVWLNINKALVEYGSFVQSPLYQTVALDYGGADNDVLRFKAVGVQGSTTDAMVTGTQLHLFTVTLRVRAGSSLGMHGGVVSLFARQFINPGSNAFLENANGFLFDSRSTAHTQGAIFIRNASPSGLFAYLSTASLANLAVLTGVPQQHTVTIVSVSSDDRHAHDTLDISHSATCTAGSGTQAFSLNGCVVTLHANHMIGATVATISAAHHQLATTVRFSVYRPNHVVVRTLDVELNRLQSRAGIVITACSEVSHSHLYQWTRALVTVDGLDATTLVTFMVSKSHIASVGSASQWNVVSGLAVGETTLQIKGRAADFASTQLIVSDTRVSTVRLISRLVSNVHWITTTTSATWHAGSLMTFVPSVALTQSLNSEGSSGTIFARIEWSDGAIEDVLPSFAQWHHQLNITSLSSNLAVVRPIPERVNTDSNFWTAQVPFGASAECGEMLRTDWRVCGQLMASTTSIVHVNLPDPISVALRSSQVRLAAPDDDATASGIGIRSSALLTVKVTFDDGHTRDFSKDSRVMYRVSDHSCAYIELGQTLRVRSGSRCSTVTVTVSIFSLAQNMTVSLVHLHKLVVDFHPYPHSGMNTGIAITRLGLMECTQATYHHASARARAYLSDDLSFPYMVTAQTSFTTSNVSILSVSGNRLHTRGIGMALIVATFGHSPVHADATLEVVAHVITTVQSLMLTTSLQAGRTLQLERGDAQSTKLRARFSNGMELEDVSAAEWLNPSNIITFSSSVPAAVDIDAQGMIFHYSNWHDEVILSASLTCDVSRGAQLRVKANLHPAQGDLDLGNPTGLQFSKMENRLHVPVRLRAPDGHRLINFQVSASFDPIYLSSATSPAGGATFAEGAWSGVESTLNDPPGRFQLVGSDPQSQLAGVVNLGLVTLNVVSNGEVTLISGFVTEAITIDANGVQHRISGMESVAGSGYADLFDARSRNGRRLGSVAIGVIHRPVRILRTEGRRALRECDPCVARVYGDVSGDCSFTSADVLAMQKLASSMQDYMDGALAYNPLSALQCDWLRRQANPSLDVMSNGQPNVDLVDAQYLQLAVANKYRFLDEITAVCNAKELTIRVRVLRGDTLATLSAESVDTDVLFELHSAYLTELPAIVMGSLNTERQPMGSHSLLLNAIDTGHGYFEVRLLAAPILNRGRIGVAVLVETKDSSQQKEVPRRFKSFHGASVEPYLAQGITFTPMLWVDSNCRPATPPLLPGVLPPNGPSPVPSKPPALPPNLPLAPFPGLPRPHFSMPPDLPHLALPPLLPTYQRRPPLRPPLLPPPECTPVSSPPLRFSPSPLSPTPWPSSPSSMLLSPMQPSLSQPLHPLPPAPPNVLPLLPVLPSRPSLSPFTPPCTPPKPVLPMPPLPISAPPLSVPNPPPSMPPPSLLASPSITSLTSPSPQPPRPLMPGSSVIQLILRLEQDALSNFSAVLVTEALRNASTQICGDCLLSIGLRQQGRVTIWQEPARNGIEELRSGLHKQLCTTDACMIELEQHNSIKNGQAATQRLRPRRMATGSISIFNFTRVPQTSLATPTVTHSSWPSHGNASVLQLVVEVDALIAYISHFQVGDTMDAPPALLNDGWRVPLSASSFLGVPYYAFTLLTVPHTVVPPASPMPMHPSHLPQDKMPLAPAPSLLPLPIPFNPPQTALPLVPSLSPSPPRQIPSMSPSSPDTIKPNPSLPFPAHPLSPETEDARDDGIDQEAASSSPLSSQSSTIAGAAVGGVLGALMVIACLIAVSCFRWCPQRLPGPLVRHFFQEKRDLNDVRANSQGALHSTNIQEGFASLEDIVPAHQNQTGNVTGGLPLPSLPLPTCSRATNEGCPAQCTEQLATPPRRATASPLSDIATPENMLRMLAGEPDVVRKSLLAAASASTSEDDGARGKPVRASSSLSTLLESEGAEQSESSGRMVESEGLKQLEGDADAGAPRFASGLGALVPSHTPMPLIVKEAITYPDAVEVTQDGDDDVRMAASGCFTAAPLQLQLTEEVTVPPGCGPGDIFTITSAEGREVKVCCPEDAGPGDRLAIDMPDAGHGSHKDHVDNVEAAADELSPRSTPRYHGPIESIEATVPAGCHPGDSFNVLASWGGLFEVVVPRGTKPGSTLFIEVPGQPEGASSESSPDHVSSHTSSMRPPTSSESNKVHIQMHV